jgi:hypothetical protein
MTRTITMHRDGEPLDVEVEAQYFQREPEWPGKWEIESVTLDGAPLVPDVTDDEYDFLEQELARIDDRAEWTDDYDDPDYVSETLELHHRSMP